MQGYNQYYQTQASMQAGPSHGQKIPEYQQQQSQPSYTYAVQSAPLQQHSMSGVMQSYPLHHDHPSYPMPTTSSHSSSSSSISFPSQSMSPNSLRSSISSSLNTPVTPLDLNSPHGSKDATAQGSWFGAMQENYLANKNVLDQQRPPLQRMHRMSVCVPRSGQHYSGMHQQGVQHSGQLLTVGDQPPRRASVATFQPTAARPSHVPRRPSMQPSNNSEPRMYAPSLDQQHALLPSPGIVAQQQSHRTFEIPSIVSPGPMSETTSEVERLYAEVFGSQTPVSLSQQATPLASLYATQPSTAVTSPTIYSPSAQVTPTMPSSSETYNFSGVMLQPEDLHMLGGDALSPTSTEVPLYPTQSSSSQNPGWQTSFSLTVPPASAHSSLQPPLPIHNQQDVYGLSSFHSFQPIVEPSQSTTMVERALSAPPREDPVMAFPGMDRRRGSSVDSVAMLPFSPSLPSVLEPVNRMHLSPTRSTPTYLGSGLSPYHQASIASRRSTVGPGALVLQPVPNNYLPATPPSRQMGRVRPHPPASAPPTTNRPAMSSSPSTRRYAGRGSARRGSGNAAPMFINFTSKDANKLLSGVAPSGSSKRKRDEEEARNGKTSRSEGMKSPGGSPHGLAPTTPSHEVDSQSH